VSDYANALERIVGDRELPDGYDRWGMKSTRADLTTRNGFQWAFPGKVTKVPKSGIDTDNTGPCPSREGDGLSVALTYAGMASGGMPARTVLLLAIKDRHVLGSDSDKLRVRSALVVALLDGERLARDHLYRANLYSANLRGANLRGANLRGADLRGADLDGADLAAANLAAANLAAANLGGADLAAADLRGAYLWGANLAAANLGGAYLWGANLAAANLGGAYGTPASWPDGFDPERAGWSA
jgi:hypothetical protein